MLNRLYIVVGILAIVVLAAAFVVPHLIPWSNYRGRMEALATKALGADVRISGDVHFALLPQPHLSLAGVSVGPAAHPVMSVKSADADFSLVDFLRDRYSLTRLVLDHPVLNVNLWNDGAITTGLTLAPADAATNISIDKATIAVGSLRFTDARAGHTYALDGINGELTLASFKGPFGFTGGGSLGDQHYNFHVTTAALDPAGDAGLSFFAQPDSGSFSITAEGTFKTGAVPRFAGDLSYRQSPQGGKDKTGVVGDLTLTSKIDATPAKIALSAYTLVPDENRGATRLTGAATIDLGPRPTFVADIAGGVLALPPRDATAEQGPQPYDLVRTLGELPALPVPPIAGTVSAEIAELGLRSFALRDVTLDATTDAKAWTIKAFNGQLAGNTAVALAGNLSALAGRPSFAGTLSVATSRLDTFSTLWRKPAPDNPLFDMPGRLDTNISLLGQTMALTDSHLTLGDSTHDFTALINFGGRRRIDLSAQFAELSADDSAALLALAPDLSQDQTAAVTFPEGAVSLAADSGVLLGLKGKELALEGKWGGGAVEISKLAAEDLGGAGFDLSLVLSGTAAAPRLAGDGSITLATAGGGTLDRLFGVLSAPKGVRDFLSRSLPADLNIHLDEPKDDGGQGLALSGKAGVADLTLDARFDGGLLKAFTAPVAVNLEMSSTDPRGLTRQLGLGDVSLVPETGPLKLTASIEGPPTAGLKSSLSLSGGGDSIAFSGNLTPGDLSSIKGQGRLDLALSDSAVAAADIGLAGLYTPPVRGSADISFDGNTSIRLDNITGTSGGTAFAGRLALAGDSKGAQISGNLTLDGASVEALVAAAGSPTALMASAGKLWPDGPLSTGDAPRRTAGTVSIEAPSVTLGGHPFLSDAGFELAWDATRFGVHKLTGRLGDGTLTVSADVCCAGSAPQKQLSGDAVLHDVPLSAVLPAVAAATLAGTLDGSARFSGGGDSIGAMISSLSGDGSFSIAKLSVQHFDPGVFAAIASMGDVVNLDPKDLRTRVSTSLDQGAFNANEVGGGFTIGSGMLRIPNVAITTPAAKIFGTTTLKLADLALGGGFALTPVGTVDAAGLVSESTSKIAANLSGTLSAPVRTLDIGTMVDSLKVRAYEIEVARLEALKAQDDARAHAAANARKEAAEDAAAVQQAEAIAARQATDEAAARQAADAAAKKAADAAAAAKKAADDAAAKKAAAARAAPLDLQMPPAQPFFRPLN